MQIAALTARCFLLAVTVVGCIEDNLDDSMLEVAESELTAGSGDPGSGAPDAAGPPPRGTGGHYPDVMLPPILCSSHGQCPANGHCTFRGMPDGVPVKVCVDTPPPGAECNPYDNGACGIGYSCVALGWFTGTTCEPDNGTCVNISGTCSAWYPPRSASDACEANLTALCKQRLGPTFVPAR